MRLGIVASRFNEELSTELLARAKAEADKLGIDDVTVNTVPGALEIPLALQWLAQTGEFATSAALRLMPFRPGRQQVEASVIDVIELVHEDVQFMRGRHALQGGGELRQADECCRALQMQDADALGQILFHAHR